jgi:serine/threonine protein kinase
VIGLADAAATIFCVDFGLSKRYRHPKNLQHIPHRDGRSLTGTPRYASINNHLGIEQSRRDDLESIGYVLIYFLKGSLPWQGLKAKNAQKKYRLIMEKKQQVSIAQLCQGCPSQFAEFLAYTRSLKFDAKPDIPYLRKLFRDLYHAQNCSAIVSLCNVFNVRVIILLLCSQNYGIGMGWRMTLVLLEDLLEVYRMVFLLWFQL